MSVNRLLIYVSLDFERHVYIQISYEYSIYYEALKCVSPPLNIRTFFLNFPNMPHLKTVHLQTTHDTRNAIRIRDTKL